MDTIDLPSMFLDTITEHIPPGADWMLWGGIGATAILGVILLVKGARLAPIIAALLGAGGGACAGAVLARFIPAPVWVPVAAGGVTGLVLGVVLLKLWLAVLVAGCLIAGTVGAYSSQVLQPEIGGYLSRGLDADSVEAPISLPPPTEGSMIEGAAQAAWQQELSGLWGHLSENVPHFPAGLITVVVAAGLVGLVFGLLLPKFSRAFWAASFGTGLLLLATITAISGQWPAAMPWMMRWGLIGAAAVWAVSLVYNLADVKGVRAAKVVPAAEKKAAD